MKYFSFIALLFLACMACVACIGKSGNHNPQATANVAYSNRDTVVAAKKVPENISGNNVHEVEYSVSINHTNYSPVILISKTQDGLIIKLESNLGNYSSENLNDTSAVKKGIVDNSVRNPASSADKYDFIRKILEKASKDFDISKTKAIFWGLSLFEDEAMQIVEQYQEKYGLGRSDFSNNKMAGIIKESSLYRNLHFLFHQYSIEMDCVYVEDIMRVFPKGKSPYMIDASVIISTL